ncbi:MAG: hypothetical protein A2V77_16295 [Anaeromyxobacter sp. RBG_16_69_14]|nr:MAG: hypothetical protein A2V77_16295 [Anaeromyxobacter sp. RBG_16_69_14]
MVDRAWLAALKHREHESDRVVPVEKGHPRGQEIDAPALKTLIRAAVALNVSGRKAAPPQARRTDSNLDLANGGGPRRVRRFLRARAKLLYEVVKARVMLLRPCAGGTQLAGTKPLYGVLKARVPFGAQLVTAKLLYEVVKARVPLLDERAGCCLRGVDCCHNALLSGSPGEVNWGGERA